MDKVEAQVQEKERGGRAKDHDHDHKVMVKVDGHPEHVVPGTYTVAAFKELVGVAADRELDIFENGAFEPLADDSEITIVGHEVFVSHVRTGGSS